VNVNRGLLRMYGIFGASSLTPLFFYSVPGHSLGYCDLPAGMLALIHQFPHSK
jgi:hypothetical protein